MGTAASAAQAVSGLVGGAPPAGPGGAADPITSTLAGMSRKQLYDILSQMKGLINQNPAQVCHGWNTLVALSHFRRVLAAIPQQSIYAVMSTLFFSNRAGSRRSVPSHVRSESTQAAVESTSARVNH